MVLNARVDVNCGRKYGRTDGPLYRTLLKQVRQKLIIVSDGICMRQNVITRAVIPFYGMTL